MCDIIAPYMLCNKVKELITQLFLTPNKFKEIVIFNIHNSLLKLSYFKSLLFTTDSPIFSGLDFEKLHNHEQQ